MEERLGESVREERRVREQRAHPARELLRHRLAQRARERAVATVRRPEREKPHVRLVLGAHLRRGEKG